MKVLVIYDHSAPKYFRCLLPCILMGVEVVVNYKLEEEQLEGVDIVFFNRMIGGTTIETVEDLRKRYGFKLIIDFDDHWRLDHDHYLFENYKRHHLSEIMEMFIRIADGVTVTHERLANEVYPLNTNVFVLPNSIPKWGQFLTKKQESDKVRLFWAGGITHRKDIELLKGPVRRLQGVRMVMGGYVKNPEFDAMASAFTDGGRVDHEIIEALPVKDYYHAYSKCGISLIPLRPGRFNSFKSNLKILEAANIGSPVIVSAVEPYLGFPERVVNYVRRQSDWNTWINSYKYHPELIEKQGKELMEYCDKNYNFDTINEARKQIFTDILNLKK